MMKAYFKKVVYNPIISSVIGGLLLSIFTLLCKEIFYVWTLESTIIAILFIWVIILIFALVFQYHNGIIVNTRKYGIKGIYKNERASDSVKEKLPIIEKLKIMIVSGPNMLKSLETTFVTLLTKNKEVEIIIGTLNSDFVEDIEICETCDTDKKQRKGNISKEINLAIDNLNMCIDKAIKIQKEENKNVIGKLSLRHFNTLLRSSIIIVNDEWAWLTLNLPPFKALDSLSIEFCKKDENSYLEDIIKHFDTVYKLSTPCSTLKECEIKEE